VPIHEFENDVETFLGRQTRIELVVGSFGILKTAEDLNNSLHPFGLYHASVSAIYRSRAETPVRNAWRAPSRGGANRREPPRSPPNRPENAKHQSAPM
jgi:hypothetical protein